MEGNRGVVVKMSGDGVHAVFDDPLDALVAVLALQRMLADPAATAGVAIARFAADCMPVRQSAATTISSVAQ